MKVLLDTNACIYVIRQKPAAVLARVTAMDVGDIGVSSITVAELHFGVAKSRHVAQNQAALEQFLAPLEILDFDAAAAAAYGRIRATLEAAGTPIGALDTLIAAHAVSLGVTLVTNNVREFVRVPDLKVEDWAAV
jgi:tRNA(fMet)-specific endonuclease VapC